jgi:RNA polymerase sporulation-specific sigma factor
VTRLALAQRHDALSAPREFTADCERLAQRAARSSGLYAPGLTDDDLVQEARVGVWRAIRNYQEHRNVPWEAFAWMCARRSLVTAVVTARRGKHRSLNEACSLDAPPAGRDDGEARNIGDLMVDERSDPLRIVIARELVRELGIRIGQLSPLEQECVRRVLLLGDDYATVGDVKRIDNAVQRGRRKLREAA